MKSYFFYTDFIIVRSERKWEVFNSVMIYTVLATTYRFLSELQFLSLTSLHDATFYFTEQYV